MSAPRSRLAAGLLALGMLCSAGGAARADFHSACASLGQEMPQQDTHRIVYAFIDLSEVSQGVFTWHAYLRCPGAHTLTMEASVTKAGDPGFRDGGSRWCSLTACGAGMEMSRTMALADGEYVLSLDVQSAPASQLVFHPAFARRCFVKRILGGRLLLGGKICLESGEY